MFKSSVPLLMKRMKELFIDFNIALFVPSIGTPEERATIVAKDTV